MGALTMARLTPQRLDGDYMNTERMGMASGVQLFVGAIVCAQGVGTGGSARAVQGKTATGLRAIGIMDQQPHLIPAASFTSTTDGIPVVQIRRGTFKVDIDPLDPVTEANLYQICYLTSDHEICKTTGGNAKSIAGRLVEIDYTTDPTGPGAWVEFGVLPTSGLPLPTGVGLP